MYQRFYNFSAEPFRLSPEHGFAYSHKGYNKARAYMDYAFMRAEGFVMITGRPGTGKTTLIGALVDDLNNTPVSVANLVCTQLQADDLLKMVAYEFGIPVSVVEKGELLQRLTRQLKTWHRDGRRALLIVDEAQDLSISAMEELRLLTNIQVDSKPLLQIFLLGQPELRELILSPRLEQVHQRIIAASHMKPLESEETEAYILHRLRAVQWRGDPAISKAVFPLIYKFSEGVPRRINLICSRLLLHCSVEQRHQVSVADVREVIKELQDENLASGKSFTESDFQVEDVFEDPPPESSGTGRREPAGGQTGDSRQDPAAPVPPAADGKNNRQPGGSPTGTANETPGSVRERRQRLRSADSATAPPVRSPAPEAKKKIATRPAPRRERKPVDTVRAEAKTAESAPAARLRARETPSSEYARRSRIRSFWSMVVLMIVTGIVITYGAWV